MAIDKDIKNVVLARLQTLPKDKVMSIGSVGQLSRNDMIKHVQEEDEIGKKLVRIEMEFLRSLKKWILQ